MNENPKSVRYVILIGKVLIVSDDFFDLVIEVKNIFRAHRVPLMCVSNGEAENEIVFACPFNKKDMFDFDHQKMKEFEHALIPVGLPHTARWRYLTSINEAEEYLAIIEKAKNEILEELLEAA